MCAGRDSNLRRHKSADLQSALVDRLSTDAITTVCRMWHTNYHILPDFQRVVMLVYTYMWKSFLPTLILLSPSVVAAAGLVPCGGIGEEQCQLCHVGALVASVGGWLATVVGIVVVILIMLAGLRMVASAGDLSAVTNARRLIANAIIGYILFLTAWMLVDTGLRFLLRQENYGVWNEIMCSSQPTPQPRSSFVAPLDNLVTLPADTSMCSTATPLTQSCNIII